MAKATATIIALITLIFAATFSASTHAIADDSTMPSPVSPMTQPSDSQIPMVDADVLKQAYTNNALRADSVYGHGPVYITGSVKRVAVNSEKQPIIGIGADGDAILVGCIFPADADAGTSDAIKSLAPGDKIKVLCQVLDLTGGVVRVRGLCLYLPSDPNTPR